MRIGSLFSGIGGLDLGLERSIPGAHVVWQVEIDPFCQRVLAKHWPSVCRSVSDVREAGAHNLAQVDLICGGFPCQDLSAAGKQAGLAGARSGLWYEFLRIVREMEPMYVVVENVASGRKKWLCEVRAGLHELGYDTTALAISAENVGAPHRRERIFVVAHPQRVRELQSEGSESDFGGRAGDGGGSELAYTDRERREDEGVIQRERAVACTELGDTYDASLDEGSRVEPRLGGGTNGLPRRVDFPAGRGAAQYPWEPPRGTPKGMKDRNARLRALGNGVVPQCAEVVGRWIAGGWRA